MPEFLRITMSRPSPLVCSHNFFCPLSGPPCHSFVMLMVVNIVQYTVGNILDVCKISWQKKSTEVTTKVQKELYSTMTSLL